MMMICWGCLWVWESRREDTLMHLSSWQDHGCVFLVDIVSSGPINRGRWALGVTLFIWSLMSFLNS